MNWIRNHKILASFAAFIVTIIVIGVAVSNSNTHTSNTVQAGSQQTVAPATTPAQPSTTPAVTPTTAAPTTPAPTTPALTLGQQQAIDTAQSYLSDGQGFSENGLLQQLTSSSGEGETRADAQFAISYLHPDWYQQAVESAKNYLADGQGFSKADLYQQLTSTYGEGFTSGQANYALSQVGY